MINNLFSSGFKLLKASTLFSGILGAVVILVLSFLVIFPGTLKETIQDQLSFHSGLDIELSKISLGLEDGNVTVLLDRVDIFPPEKNIPVASIKELQWNINMSSLYDNMDLSKIFNDFNMVDIADSIYKPNSVYIGDLLINDNSKYSRDVFGVKDITKLFSSNSMKVLYFIRSLKVDRIQLQSKEDFEIGAMKIERNDYQLLLTINDQDLSFNNNFPALTRVNIVATLATDKADLDNFITLPIKVSNDELSIYGNIKVISNRDDDLIKYEGYIPVMEASQISKHFSKELLGEENYKQLNSTGFSGVLSNIVFDLSSSVSSDGLIKSEISADMENFGISNNQLNVSINDIKGSISTNFSNMIFKLQSAMIDDIQVSNTELTVNNLGNAESSLNVVANINSKSESLIKFLRRMKLGSTVNNALDKFTLNGKVSGTSTLQMPLNGGAKKIAFDLNVAGNKLKVLGDDIVVEDFSSNIVYKDQRISMNGDGYMEGIGKVNIQLPNSTFKDLSLNVVANIDSKSESLIKFLRRMKLGSTVNNALDKFTLNGKVSGTSTLQMPLNGGAKKIAFDLNVAGNKLKVLGDDIVVEDFSSNIVYKDNHLRTSGRGFFRSMHFDISLNPANFYEDEKSSLKLKLTNKTSGAEFHIRQYNENLWLAKIDSGSINSEIVVDLNNKNPYVEINNLIISSVKSIGGDLDIYPRDVPSMRIAVQNINIDNELNAIPNFKVNLISNNDTVLIRDLVFDGVGLNNEESLSFNGAWLSEGQTGIMAYAEGERLSSFFKKLNIDEEVTGGEFNFDVRLFCDCTPWNIGYNNLNGIMRINASEGVFNNRGPSFGRILSLLNIQSIAKRLRLDIADVVQEGFAYDTIVSEILIENSLAKINKFDLNSTSSKIQLEGSSNLVNKQYDIEAIVHPAISEAVPAATFMAGGGLIGLGVWLVDESIFDGKILDFIADTVVEFKYKIGGSWEEPTIDFVSFNKLL